jgi:AcrR family transcriptional regulator
MQARSRTTVEAILTATARILVERGYAKTTTVAVAERAGVSVGSLYQYFPGKDALIAALLERHMAGAVQMMERATTPGRAGRSLADDVDAQMGALLAAKTANPRLAIALKAQVPMRRGFPSMRALLARIERLVRGSLEEHRAGRRRSDLAAFLLVSAVDGVLSAVIEQRRDLLEGERLRSALVQLMSLPDRRHPTHSPRNARSRRVRGRRSPRAGQRRSKDRWPPQRRVNRCCRRPRLRACTSRMAAFRDRLARPSSELMPPLTRDGLFGRPSEGHHPTTSMRGRVRSLAAFRCAPPTTGWRRLPAGLLWLVSLASPATPPRCPARPSIRMCTAHVLFGWV